MVQPYILRSTPHIVPKIWGGYGLGEFFAKTLPALTSCGEAWEVSDLKEGSNLIDNGPLQGKTLRDVVELWGHQLTGNHERFPLLIKLLVLSDLLSCNLRKADVRVHGRRMVAPNREVLNICSFSACALR